MALPLIAVGLVGIYVYKKIKDKKSEKENEDKKTNDEKFHIESIPFLVATLYAVANIDGTIDEKEQVLINKEINNMLDNIDELENKEKIESNIRNIEEEKLSIKLSDAIDYITVQNQEFIRKDLKRYKELAENVAKEDGRLDDTEVELLKRLDIIYEKGRDAKKEIIKLENEDLLPNFYYASSDENKKLTPTTEIITKKETRFTNLNELQLDKYYVKHPMNQKLLFDLQDLDRIDELQIIELQNLVSNLGAKSFSCKAVLEAKEHTNNSQNTNVSGSIIKGASDFEVKSNNYQEDYEKKFTQYEWTAEGKKSDHTKEMLINNLLWLKNDPKAKDLIERMTSVNKLKSYKFEISLKEFKKINSNFNLSAQLSLLEKINFNLKKEIESNIKRSLDYSLKVDITF